MIKAAAVVLVGVLALGSCDEKPGPMPTWAPGDIRPQATVKSKQIIRLDPKNPGSAVICYQIVLEWSARTDVYCTTKQQWEQAEPGKLMSWE